jgi:hypothetical protein
MNPNAIHAARIFTTMLFAASLAAGCSVAATSDPPSDREGVASTSEAYTQNPCTIVGAQQYGVLPASGQTVSSTTVDIYAYTPQTSPCGDEYIFQIDDTLSRSYTPFATWADATPIGQTACTGAHVNALLFGFDALKREWVEISPGLETAYGVWRSILYTGICFLPNLDFSTIDLSPYSAIRVVGQARDASGGFAKVTLGAIAK